MVNSVKILGLLILLTNICIQANVIGDTNELTDEFEFANRNQQKFVDFAKILESPMIRKLRKDDKKTKQKCVIKMAVCILSVPVKPK